MNTPRKARGDSVLKTLPEARQAALAEYGAAHTLAETVAWLKKDGIKSNANSVSEFLSWHALRQQLSQNESTVESLLEQLKESNPNISPEALDQAGQMFFTALSIQQKDSLGWKRAQEVKIKGQTLELLERRVVLLEKKAAQADAAKEVVDSALPPDEQRRRLKEILK